MIEDAQSPASDVGAIHWRAKYANHRQRDYESLVVILWRAVAGTTLAGCAFPTVMTLAGICTGRFSLGEAIALLMASVVLMSVPSGFIAFVMSLPVTAVAGVVGRLMGVTDRDVWFASLVGGWSGFFVCHLGGQGPGASTAVIGLAIVTGQVGAGAYAYYQLVESGAVLSDEVRFGVRKLFGVTTAVAVLAVVARAMIRRGALQVETAMMAVGIQATVIALGIAARVYARRRRAAIAVSREAAQRMAVPAATTSVARGTPIERATRSG